MNIAVNILVHNNITAVGLRYILKEFFNAEASILHKIPVSDDMDSSISTIYFVDTNMFIANHDFFIPRKSRTIVLTSNDTSSDIKTLNPNQDESSIIEDIRLILSLYSKSEETPQVELSQREIDVLRLIALGHLNKEIADNLSISINTVLSHRKNITAKLGIRSVSGLSYYAIMHGYISDCDIRR